MHIALLLSREPNHKHSSILQCSDKRPQCEYKRNICIGVLSEHVSIKQIKLTNTYAANISQRAPKQTSKLLNKSYERHLLIS